MEIYNKVRAVPKEALKPIQGGRLKGKSDINPMWRLKMLTELFGVCGIGWKYVITKQWLETGGKEEIAAFVNIDLHIKVDDTWSDAIPGTGGSSFVAKENSGMYTSDECFKMALTDAISVACKALGFGADVYWSSDSTKYEKSPEQSKEQPISPERWQNFLKGTSKLGYKTNEVAEFAGVTIDELEDWTPSKIVELFEKLKKIMEEK